MQVNHRGCEDDRHGEGGAGETQLLNPSSLQVVCFVLFFVLFLFRFLRGVNQALLIIRHRAYPEMQKAADAADISVLFFSSAGANFWAILGYFWPFWPFWVIFGLFWEILGHFWAIFGANLLWQNMHLCYLNRFLQL